MFVCVCLHFSCMGMCLSGSLNCLKAGCVFVSFTFDSVLVDKGEWLGHELNCDLGKALKGPGGGSRAKQIPVY